MEAKDLRIGNFTHDRGGKLFRVDYWEQHDKVAQEMYINNTLVHPLTEYIEHLNPIPLTEEWHEKFENNYLFEKTAGFIWIEIDGCDYVIKEELLEFVHQWQNLYHALTGEELELKNGVLPKTPIDGKEQKLTLGVKIKTSEVLSVKKEGGLTTVICDGKGLESGDTVRINLSSHE